MKRRDVYDEMRRSGHYSDAEEYRNTCEWHGHSMTEYVQSWNHDDVQDGCIHTTTGDRAMEAVREIERERRRIQEREEEEQERQVEEKRRYQERQKEPELEDLK